jgi:heat shock protein HtpX
MDRYHARRAYGAAKVSSLEEVSFVAGLILIAAGCVAALINFHAGGVARALGSVGLAGILICATARGLRLYHAGTAAALPTSVAKVRIRTKPSRTISLATVLLSLVLPLAAGVTVVALVDWGWLVIVGVVLLGSVAVFRTWTAKAWRHDDSDARSEVAAAELLQRLCMRAGVHAPPVVVRPGLVATAWTASGRIHVTRQLLELLDQAELEAVLAHEVAHFAHRDAAVMEICSAPSRVLLAFAASLRRRAGRWVSDIIGSGLPGSDYIAAAVAIVPAFSIPPTFAMGWLSRLSVLGMSRAREFAADAAAAALTGRPSALASALLKLEHQREWAPRADLREIETYAVLSIVGTPRYGFRRLIATHPPVTARVKRLEEVEGRIQARSTPSRFWEPADVG